MFVADRRARFYAQMRHDMGDVNFILWRLHQPGGMNRLEFESRFPRGSSGDDGVWGARGAGEI